ncbi:hypothetical protein [Halopelagius longus]|uniref:Uncharacterized protein n=1 Tax=Halopelagius longus TaxID=1236180 RepID=A0A1H1EKP8_9EURY|nr:hypothetical protein [Halopelagius longus]RDI71776.1 hypothetical protein DWB78_08575 [Halopelagius longus]SDQ88726.1 hypothetical protein SAMN05216278_2930 [Halopelagius longus]
MDAEVRTDAGATREYDDPLGDILPRADVDSRWWYWIAAVPAFGLAALVGGVFFLFGFLFDLFLTGGLLTFGAAFFLVPAAGLVGLVLTVMYPIATYVDARAVAESRAEWTPDPLVWGLVALASVVLSAFSLSVVASLYYLYKRHGAVGTP